LGKIREKNEVLDIPSYVTFRHETSAVRTCFDLVEYYLGLDLPEYVHDDPVFVTGYNAAMDLIFWTNVCIPSITVGYLIGSLGYRICSLTTWSRPRVMVVQTL
jgi:hypothetical protein